MNNIIIEAKELNKTYESLHIIKNISLTINKGSFTVIHGKSGSGKTTLLSLLSGLEATDSGKIFLNNIQIDNKNEEKLANTRRNEFGFVFQSFNLLPVLTAVENVMIPLVPVTKSKQELRQKALSIMQFIGIEHRKTHLPAKLSGGEKQRVAIARALINDPEIIFADEPTGNLDTETGKTVIDLLFKLKSEKNLTIILVTHDDDILKMADNIIKIKDGRIME